MSKPDSNTPTGAKSAPSAANARPVDAATLIVVDQSDGLARVLMGQRRKDLAFMPGKYVFPGGRVDKCDRNIPIFSDLPAPEIAKLMMDMKGKPSEVRARSLALAAIRETYEEAGLLICAKPEAVALHDIVDEAEQTEEMTNGPATGLIDSASWQSFCSHGFLPRLDALTFFARAITPPGRPRRFDTRFFCVDAGAIGHRVETRDDELLSLDWLTLEETASFDLPGITRVIIEDLTERLEHNPQLTTAPAQTATQDASVPYYYFRNGIFHRELI